MIAVLFITPYLLTAVVTVCHHISYNDSSGWFVLNEFKDGIQRDNTLDIRALPADHRQKIRLSSKPFQDKFNRLVCVKVLELPGREQLN